MNCGGSFLRIAATAGMALECALQEQPHLPAVPAARVPEVGRERKVAVAYSPASSAPCGDFCLGKVWALRRSAGKWVSALVADTPYQITSFGEDDAGNLHLTDYATGSVILVRGQ